ncbi:hypothetical protein [Thermoleptolyngbya sp. M55_K2018_002]|uniref:hypothetical protein n=1 Tax=Thermoleptolyngbya sp. M55_K2018_002 TaxID=2747808 RepID=UPI001A066248|nr:hypothetical protein [Thermoleptolyngbya sp. M55_K2018_002]HIK39905.1 hypothetical protein [Thermoleptolyngbya sp. M55_K2018_002]
MREIWVSDRPFPFFRLYFLLALWLLDSVTAELHKWLISGTSRAFRRGIQGLYESS